MNRQKGAIPLVAIIVALAVLVGGYFIFRGMNKTESGPTQQTTTAEQKKEKESSPAVGAGSNQDVSGEWTYTSKISGNSKTGPMTFTASEVRFDMMAARYSVSGSEIQFSLFGGFLYSGIIRSADYMVGAVTKDGKEVGTWDAKRVGSAETADASDGQRQISGTGEESASVIDGNWEFEVISMAQETKTTLLFQGEAASGIFTNGDSLTGKYSLTGSDIKLTMAGGTEHIGTIANAENMSGKTFYSGSQIGTWSAKKRGDVQYDIRDGWNLTTTNDKPAGSKPMTFEIIAGYMKTQSSVPPSMTAGKITFTADTKNVMDYKVNWPGGDVTFVTWNGSITYTGKFEGKDTMKGTFKGAGLSSDAGGTWIAGRIKD